jgi:hypothetical protein
MSFVGERRRAAANRRPPGRWKLCPLPSARQTAPLALLLFASAGGVLVCRGATTDLRPQTSGPTLANVDCRPKNPIGANSSHRAYHQHSVATCYARGPAFVVLCYLPPLERSACAAGRTLICVIVNGAHLLEHLGSLQCASAPAAFACLDILQIWQPQVCPGTLPYHPRTWSLHKRPGQNLPMRFWPAGARINPSPRPSRHQDPRNGRFFDTNRRDRGPSVTLLNTRMNYLVV